LNKKGFTLIELLVVIVIIGILVAIALPNFIKIKDKAREAEVKQNLHSIQLAVERYGTDEEGNYPYYLYGGDTRFNIGTHASIVGLQTMNYPSSMKLAFDMFNLGLDNGWDYSDVGDLNGLLADDLQAGYGDTLAYEGYLPKYPGNPFVTGKGAQQYSWEFLQYGPPASIGAGFGGYDGTCSWNLGWYGDWFYLHKFEAPSATAISDLSGQFFYHPRWQDGVTNLGHMAKQRQAIENSGGFDCATYADYGTIPTVAMGAQADMSDVFSLDVAAYDLVATGSPRTKGQDLDNSGAIFSGEGYANEFRTGYLTMGQERNPWIAQGDAPWNATENYAERPFSDSIPDFLIIHLSSGLDKKMQNDLTK
jgi:prepilin-type N-terminal cleavage/methylation domain-containing protein